MSVAEMKLKAFEELAHLNDEEGVRQVLEHLQKLNEAQKQKVYNLSRHFEDLSNRYDDTLKKLAQ